jgi:hypothetical protein
MTPEEIKAIIKIAIDDGLPFSKWYHIAAITVICSLINVGFVGFVGWLTEKIKHRFIKATWFKQQLWSTRERKYTDFLTLLAKLEIALADQLHFYDEPGSEHKDEDISYLTM